MNWVAMKTSDSYRTGKGNNTQRPQITLDSNMVGYLYVLSRPDMTMQEFERIRKEVSNEQMDILLKIVHSDFQCAEFNTTSQVINEVVKYSRAKKDPEIVNFLARICKVHIPKSRSEKIKCAELMVDLMDDYLRHDIPLSNNVRAYESAIASEIKDGEEDFSDAKIVAENTLLNGCPVVTRNEKHLISMSAIKRRNNGRSVAILDKNEDFITKHRGEISSRKVRQNLNNLKSTTFRINDFPYLIKHNWKGM